MLDRSVQRAFESVLDPRDVLSDPVACRAYECDGLTGHRVVPQLVLLPRSAEQVAAAVRVCAEHEVPFVARGAGTGLSGGALPVADGVVIGLNRLNRVLEVDPVDRRATVEPGVTNLDVTKAVAQHGLYYAPDPSSQQVCTIGGNVAENSGGAHCLKYGFTTNHVLAIEVVLPDGSVVTLGADTGEQQGPDLRGVFLGSEGTLGIVTKVTVRLLRTPESVRTLLADFPSIAAAGDVGLRHRRGRHRARRRRDDGHPRHRGRRAGRARRLHDRHAGRARRRAGRAGRGVRLDVRAGQGDLRAPRLHAAAHRGLHRGAGGDLARAARRRSPPSGGSAPTTSCRTAWCRAPGSPRRSTGSPRWAGEAGIRVANVFHAGDGNLHPLVLYSAAAGEGAAAEKLTGEIAELCVEMGGSLSGEHGIGTDKACSMPKMFSDGRPRRDGAGARRVGPARASATPGKVLPTPRLCGERPGQVPGRIRWRRRE